MSLAEACDAGFDPNRAIALNFDEDGKVVVSFAASDYDQMADMSESELDYLTEVVAEGWN